VAIHSASLAPTPAALAEEGWGKLAYGESLARQHRYVDLRRRGSIVDTIVSVEHPPTITLGRHAPTDDILFDRGELAARGIELVRTDRGGRATYHGPGQAVVYPIVAITERALGVKRWVALLEDALLETLAATGVSARCVAGRPGLWAGEAKIASVGLRVARGVSYHGVSLNVGLDVSGFDCIVTCGVVGQRVTSIAAESGATPPVEQVSARLSRAIADRLEARRPR
jgi:lipoyl(octanoyl) transferase